MTLICVFELLLCAEEIKIREKFLSLSDHNIVSVKLEPLTSKFAVKYLKQVLITSYSMNDLSHLVTFFFEHVF